jgi:formate hydrogenlyase subunit 4
MLGLAAVLMAVTLVPLGNFPALIAFPADFFLFACLLGLMRFFTVLAALDTGSSFEGMGASREVFFSALAEPALLVALATLARQAGSLSLSTIFSEVSGSHWLQAGPVMALVLTALMVVLLAENSRIPVDDPNTHLELTMIHEVMVLDHGGPDFAFILYGAALKLWVLAALIVGMIVPDTETLWLNLVLSVSGMFLVAIIVGVVESVMARLRLLIVPQLLVGAGALAAMAFLLGLNK